MSSGATFEDPAQMRRSEVIGRAWEKYYRPGRTDLEAEAFIQGYLAACADPTPEQVTAALQAYWGPWEGWSRSQVEKMASALRAAASVR